MCLKKGYKLTKQGTSIFRMGWRQVTSDMQGEKMASTMTMESNSEASAETQTSPILPENPLFRREVCAFLYPSASLCCECIVHLFCQVNLTLIFTELFIQIFYYLKNRKDIHWTLLCLLLLANFLLERKHVLSFNKEETMWYWMNGWMNEKGRVCVCLKHKFLSFDHEDF